MLRIIAGELRGRRIAVPKVAGLRPTGERVREALFSILGARVEGARVLDAYAGTGALGFEALSRGATHVVFIEAEGRLVEHLESTAARIGVAERCTVIAGSVLGALGRGPAGGPFDLILADPPWDAGQGPALTRRVGERGVLAAGGLLVVERAAREAPLAAGRGLELLRSARYGDTALDFLAPAGPG